MSDHLVSLIRTYVPIGVGAVLAWIAAKTGVVVDEQSQQGAIVFLTGILSGLYYAGARWLEEKNPVFGILLGSKKQPKYQ